MRLRTILVLATFVLAAGAHEKTFAADWKWTVVLRNDDIIAGQALQKLNTRRHWAWRFDNGTFEIAVLRSSIPIPSPKCRMDYLILAMPVYYPENPAQAPIAERRAVYDALLNINKAGRGSLTVHFDALWYAEQGPSGAELTTCNIYFTLPLSKDAAKISP
jgi:hypothetical protein